jgi:hypothetical protein
MDTAENLVDGDLDATAQSGPSGNATFVLSFREPLKQNPSQSVSSFGIWIF